MASYATVNDVQNRTLRKLSNDELNLAKKLLQDAAVIIDLYAPGAQADAKKIVSCRWAPTRAHSRRSATARRGATRRREAAASCTSRKWKS